MAGDMKVTGPGTGQGPEAAGRTPDADATEKPQAAAGGDGQTFAEKLQKLQNLDAGAPPSDVDAATAARTDPADRLTTDLAEELRAGKVGTAAALERVVERIIDSQAGPHAPQAVRDSLRAALREALEQDPYLAELAEKLSSSEP